MTITTLSYDTVDWIDTDASEDEDYLPQSINSHFSLMTSIKDYINSTEDNIMEEEEYRKRDRNNSTSFNLRELSRRKIEHKYENPIDKTSRVINETIDNGLEKVDLSNIGLKEIPNEIIELKYVTVLHNDIVKPASLQLFLYNNEITSLNPILFKLKNLTVLSLRNNNLSSIPHEIGLLENLVEISLGNNQLTVIPMSLTKLKKLTIVSLLPNPFLPKPEKYPSKDIYKIRNPRSLKEITMRYILSNKIKLENQLPELLLKQFEKSGKCDSCNTLFILPDKTEILWDNFLGNKTIPFYSKSCIILFPSIL